MNHGSFGDTMLSAATPESARAVLHNLMLTIDVTRAFLDKFLKGDTRTLLDTTGTAEVRITKR
jgi:hypothetical protein